MSIIQLDNTNVNQKANGFILAGMNDALQGCNISGPVSPPIGVSPLAFVLPRDTSWGGYPKKPNLPNLDSACHKDKLFNLDYYQGMSCSLDSHSPDEVFSTRLDTCKQVGILKSKPIRDPVPDWFKRFGELRDRREKLADVLFEAGRYKEAKNVRNCGESFIAFKAFCCGDTLARPMSCGHRLCPVCMIRRSAKLAVKVEKFILKMREPKHIVLTAENVPSINKAYFSELRLAFVKLRHRDIFNKCIGGFYSIETTYNSKLKSWHVHIHIVADVPFIPKQELSNAWNSITEGSFVVDIKQIGKEQTPQEASKEVAKYVVKPGDFLQDPRLVDEYLKAVKGSRLVSTFGKYYRMVLDDDEDEGGLPDCWCGTNDWRRLNVFYGIADVFKDIQGFYRLKTIISIDSS